MLKRIQNIDEINQLKEDDSPFTEEFPYMLWRKNYNGTGEEVVLHYHDSFEVIISEGLEGERLIEGHKFALSGNTLFVVPSGALHAASIHPNNGGSVILKFSVDALSGYIDLNKIFALQGISWNQVPFISPFYNELPEYIDRLEKSDDADIFTKLDIFSAIFRSIYKACIAEGSVTDHFSTNKSVYNNKMRKIIDWTIENAENRIDLKEAAQNAALSKTYFCEYFRKHTHITYFSYVNQVKIERASKLLLEGMSVTETCYSCGFSNISYFIQLFKSIKGVTPTKYLKEMLPESGVSL